jgi:hypothetical protein
MEWSARYGKFLGTGHVFNWSYMILLWRCNQLSDKMAAIFDEYFWPSTVCLDVVSILWFVVKFYRVGRTSNSKTIPYLGLIYSNGKGETFLIIYVYSSLWIKGTCFHSKNIYATSSSLLQGKYLPFSPSRLRLNIFRLFA